MTVFELLKPEGVSKATAPLAEYISRLGAEPLIVTRRGMPIAALVPIDGVDLESLSVGTDPDFLALIERSRARRRTEGTVSAEEITR